MGAKEQPNDFDRIARTKKFKDLKASLIGQLERGGNDVSHFLDLVDDYMKLYTTKELCAEDIRERGVSIVSTGSAGQTVIKKNESVDLLLRTNAQMLKLLGVLGIRPEGVPSDDEDL